MLEYTFIFRFAGLFLAVCFICIRLVILWLLFQRLTGIISPGSEIKE